MEKNNDEKSDQKIVIKKFFNIILYPFRRWTTLFDRYVISYFFSTSLFTFLIIISVAIAIDYSEKTNHFVKKNPPREEILGYYMDFIPYIGAILAPLLIFIAVIFFTARLAFNSEVIAFLNSGATFRRFLRPYILCGIISALFLLYANHWVVPEANKGKLEFEQKYIKAPKTIESNIHVRLDEHTLVSLERYKFSNDEGTHFTLERYEGVGKSKKLSYKINSDKVQLMPSVPGEYKWRLVNYKRWTINGLKENYSEGKTMDTVLAMKPDDFDLGTTVKETLNYEEMETFMHDEKTKGTGGLEFYRVEQYRRTSSAISVIILILIGASLGSKKVRGGIGLHLVAAITLSALYVVFQQFASTFSTKGSLPPLLGTNIPNLIFLIVTIFVVKASSK